MGELINGRTPEEIKDALKHCIEPVPYGCEVCPYNETCLEHAPEIDALALIELLESERDAALAKVPKWISVEEREPEFPCICYDGVNVISIPKNIASLTLKSGEKVFVSDTAISVFRRVTVKHLCNGMSQLLNTKFRHYLMNIGGMTRIRQKTA